jgi:hypothetical protein
MEPADQPSPYASPYAPPAEAPVEERSELIEKRRPLLASERFVVSVAFVYAGSAALLVITLCVDWILPVLRGLIGLDDWLLHHWWFLAHGLVETVGAALAASLLWHLRPEGRTVFGALLGWKLLGDLSLAALGEEELRLVGFAAYVIPLALLAGLHRRHGAAFAQDHRALVEETPSVRAWPLWWAWFLVTVGALATVARLGLARGG